MFSAASCVSGNAAGSLSGSAATHPVSTNQLRDTCSTYIRPQSEPESLPPHHGSDYQSSRSIESNAEVLESASNSSALSLILA